ncbi:MAG: hypothetical protein ACREHD_10725 [Pirellulales bacterium]
MRDDLKAKYSQPYFPEKERSEQSVSTAIRIEPWPKSQLEQLLAQRPDLIAEHDLR